MDDTRNVTQYRQEDVDEKVGIATALEEDTKGRKDDGEDNLADVATVGATLLIILITARRKSRSRVRKMVAGENGMTFGAVVDEGAHDLPCRERHDQ